MISKPQKSIRELFMEGTPIDDALGRAVEDALRRHKLLGQSIVVWRDGRVVRIPADQIEIPLPDDAPPQSQS